MATQRIHLGDEQSRKAEELANRSGTSPADVVNRAVDALYNEANGRTSEGRTFDFFADPSAEDLAAAQGSIQPVANLSELQGDFWPKDESGEEFTAWLHALRREE